MKKVIVLMIIMVVLLITPGCNIQDEEVDIYASIYPVYFITDYIVKDKMVVKQVYPTGADVHEYDPGNGQEIVKMSKAKIMFYIGAGLEGFISKSQSIFDTQPIQLVELSRSIKLCTQTSTGYEYINQDDENSRSLADTHVWLDPMRMDAMAKVVLEKIIELDPENESFYTTNYYDLSAKLELLEKEYKTKLSSEEFEKIIIVDHDSYIYWEERYGIKRIRTRVDNESCDSSPSNINENIEIAKKYNIKYIVTTAHETVCGIIDKYASTLGAEVVEINHLSTLYKDDIKNKRDYFTIMYENLDTLVKILPKKA